MIVITFDSVRKDSKAKEEYRMVNRASCSYAEVYYESVGDGDNLKKLLGLVPWDKCHFNDIVRVMRVNTSVFEEVPLKSWLFPVNNQPEQFRQKLSRGSVK
tara:strand:- start:13 stop:315 length:303 start_codon:yes stop_codon:yes gene_type:complete